MEIKDSKNKTEKTEKRRIVEEVNSDCDESDDSYWYSSTDPEDCYESPISDNDGEIIDPLKLEPDVKTTKIPKESRYKLTMWTAKTHYDVVKEVSKFQFEYHLTKKSRAPWDVAWWDGPIPLQIMSKMKPWQRCNHFPGIYHLATKNMLGRHLMRMQKEFPEEYDFFPATFVLPHDFKDFMALLGEKRNKTFIVKPEASS